MEKHEKNMKKYVKTMLICRLAWGVMNAFLWSAAMAIDFDRRYNRMKLCTHLLDPKRETFKGDEMRRSYRPQLFGSVSKIKPKNLKGLDLQTIDIYSNI